MTITCPECHTRFSLDDSRIQGPTAKVRCSRCRHIFKVNKEGQVLAADLGPQAPRAAEAVKPAPAPEAAPGPPPSIPEAPGPVPVEPADSRSPASTRAHPRGSAGATPGPAALAVVCGPDPGGCALGGIGVAGLDGTPPGPLQALIQRCPAPEGQGGAPPTVCSGPWPGKPGPGPRAHRGDPAAPPTPAQDLTELAVDWAQAHYQGLVNDKGGGQLLLIQGEVINKGKSPRGPVRLKATLMNAQHHPLREEFVYAGTTLSDNELKTLSPEEIKGWLTRPGGRSQERVLKPGEKEPFAVVFFGVPNNLAETQSGFQLVVVEGPVAE